MIKMRVGNQHNIDRRQVVDFDPWLPQPLQHEQPARKIRVNDNVFPANLHQEAGMTNERHPHLAVRNQLRLVRFTNSRGDGGVPYESAKLLGAFAEGRILERLLQHEMQLLAVRL